MRLTECPCDQAAIRGADKDDSAGPKESRFVGVRWSNRLWLAEVRDEQGKEVVLEVGAFASEEQAARAFDAGARLVRQECAHGGPCEGSDWRLNFPSAAEIAGRWARWRSAALDDQPVRARPLASL